MSLSNDVQRRSLSLHHRCSASRWGLEAQFAKVPEQDRHYLAPAAVDPDRGQIVVLSNGKSYLGIPRKASEPYYMIGFFGPDNAAHAEILASMHFCDS